MNETLVTLSFTLPVSEAKSLLERIGGPECASPNVVVPSTGTTHLRLKSEDVAMLMKGENAALVVKTFVEHGGRLFNKDLASALNIETRPQLTFKPLATLTLRLRKLRFPDKNWYQRERIDGKTFLRLRPDVADLFERAVRLAQESEQSNDKET